jgi:predicted GTPase
MKKILIISNSINTPRKKRRRKAKVESFVVFAGKQNLRTVKMVLVVLDADEGFDEKKD